MCKTTYVILSSLKDVFEILQYSVKSFLFSFTANVKIQHHISIEVSTKKLMEKLEEYKLKFSKQDLNNKLLVHQVSVFNFYFTDDIIIINYNRNINDYNGNVYWVQCVRVFVCVCLFVFVLYAIMCLHAFLHMFFMTLCHC